MWGLLSSGPADVLGSVDWQWHWTAVSVRLRSVEVMHTEPFADLWMWQQRHRETLAVFLPNKGLTCNLLAIYYHRPLTRLAGLGLEGNWKIWKEPVERGQSLREDSLSFNRQSNYFRTYRLRVSSRAQSETSIEYGPLQVMLPSILNMVKK